MSLEDKEQNVKRQSCSKYENFKSKITIENAAYYHALAVIFSFKQLITQTFSFIELFFLPVAETEGFLELDYETLFEILNSYDVHASEIEVVRAAYAWLSHDAQKREKCGYRLLSAARLYFMSDEEIRYIVCNIL